MQRKDWQDLLAILKEQMNFGILIVMCEQVWSLPENKENVYMPVRPQSHLEEPVMYGGAGEEDTGSNMGFTEDSQTR